MNKLLLIFFLFIGFYISIIAYSDFEEFSSNFKNFRLELMPVILTIGFLGYLMTGIRQQFLLKALGVDISLKDNVLLYFSGLSLILSPGGAGEAIKSYYLKKRFGHSISKTLPLAFVERFLDLISILVVIIFASIFFQINEILFVLIIICPISFLAYLAVRKKNVFAILIKIMNKIKRLQKYNENLTESYDGLHIMTSSKVLMKSIAIGIASQILYGGAIYLVFVGFGVDIEFLFSILVVYSSFLLGALSLLPAGIGLTELTAIKLLTDKGLELSLATSIIITVRVVTTWLGTVLGVITSKIFLSNNTEK